MVRLIVGIIGIRLRRGNDWIGEASSEIILFNVMMDYAESAAQALSLYLVRLRQLLLLIQNTMLLHLLHPIIHHLRIIHSRIRRVYIIVLSLLRRRDVRIAFLLFLVVKLSY